MKFFTFYFTREQRKRSAEGSDEEKETPGKHEKKKSKKDKKKSKEKEKEEGKEKDSSDEVSKHYVGHLQDYIYRRGIIGVFSRRATGFHGRTNLFELKNFSLDCQSNLAGKIILTAG